MVMKKNDSIESLSVISKALGDPARIKIIQLLSKGNYCVNALTRFLGISQPGVSQHLKVLKQAGLIVPNKKGYWVHYTVNKDAIQRYLTNFQDFLNLKEVEKNEL